MGCTYYLVGVYTLNTLSGCIYLNTLLGCKHLIPCWGVLPSTETQVPFPHHVSAVACLLQKHWQHWKSCLKYFRKFSLDIDFSSPVGTPPARRGFKARCCRPRWKGYLRWEPVSLWGNPFHIFLFCTLQPLVYQLKDLTTALCYQTQVLAILEVKFKEKIHLGILYIVSR